MLGTLHPIDSEKIEVSNISQTKENTNTANNLAYLLCIPLESSFQAEQNNSKQSILLQDTQIQQEGKDMLS